MTAEREAVPRLRRAAPDRAQPTADASGAEEASDPERSRISLSQPSITCTGTGVSRARTAPSCATGAGSGAYGGRATGDINRIRNGRLHTDAAESLYRLGAPTNESPAQQWQRIRAVAVRAVYTIIELLQPLIP